MNYKPKCYKCECKMIENHFILNNEESTFDIRVDQSLSIIIERMKEILNGRRKTVYLTRGMRDIDISYSDGKWQLFDEFDIYEFEYEI